MRAASFFHGSKSERTFAIALALLGAIAVIQFSSAFVIYWHRARESRLTSTSATAPATVAVAAHAGPAATSQTIAPQSAPPAASGRQSAPQRVAAPGESVPNELLQVAKALRLHGDTGNAIAKLQQAAALAPQNPEILAELALTYESMQLFDRANDTWRKLLALGPAAGPLAELAELKLRVGVPVQGIPGSQGRSPETAAGTSDDVSGIPDGSAFGISQVTQTMLSTDDAQTKLTLRVGVKRRPNTSIDSTKVKIQVFFYDVVNNEQVLLTDADVSFEWVTPAHNWKDTDTEVLDVTYERQKSHYPAPGAQLAPVPDSVEKATRKPKKTDHAEEPAAGPSPVELRQYLGYIVRVYYQDELQAVRADPTKLLNLFPPPFTAPPE